MELLIEKADKAATMPTRGSELAACWDLYACIDEEQWIEPHETLMVSTGLKIAIPAGYFGALFARSGIASKQGLRPGNCVGVIDADYRGTWMVALHNDSACAQKIVPNMRIAQFCILPVIDFEMTEVSQLDETARGEKGFGSTGIV